MFRTNISIDWSLHTVRLTTNLQLISVQCGAVSTSNYGRVFCTTRKTGKTYNRNFSSLTFCMTDKLGWQVWLTSMAVKHGWHEWLESIADKHGWQAWLASMARSMTTGCSHKYYSTWLNRFQPTTTTRVRKQRGHNENVSLKYYKGIQKTGSYFVLILYLLIEFQSFLVFTQNLMFGPSKSFISKAGNLSCLQKDSSQAQGGRFYDISVSNSPPGPTWGTRMSWKSGLTNPELC